MRPWLPYLLTSLLLLVLVLLLLLLLLFGQAGLLRLLKLFRGVHVIESSIIPSHLLRKLGFSGVSLFQHVIRGCINRS